MHFALTKSERWTDPVWSGIKPVRSLTEVARLMNMTEQEVQCAERIAFRKIRQMLPRAKNRMEAARAIEVSYLFAR